MYFRVSRIAFWLSAAAAAWVVLRPDGRSMWAIATAVVAALVGLACRVIDERAPVASDVAGDATASSPLPPLDRLALQEATDLLLQAVHQAEIFGDALHAAARVLRNELGALKVNVFEVREVGPTHALIAESIESQPEFQAVSRELLLDKAPLSEALCSQRESAHLSDAAVPVVAGDRVVALIELQAIALVVETSALVDLLRLARLLLSERAPFLNQRVLHVTERPRIGSMLSPRSSDSGMLGGSSAPSTQTLLADDLPPASSLTPPREAPSDRKQPQVRSQNASPIVIDSGSSVVSHAELADDAEWLDAASLDRLAELDPTGANRLLERVLGAFQISSMRLRLQGEEARRDGDRAALRLVVHTLKSSSASVGALALSKLCAGLETRIRVEEVMPPTTELDAFDAALDATLQAIGRLLEKRR